MHGNFWYRVPALLLALTLALTGCRFMERPEGLDAASLADPAANPDEKLRGRLAAYTDEELLWFESGDFDGDGVPEAFALTGAETGDPPGGIAGTPWFLTEDTAVELRETGVWHAPELWELEGDVYLRLQSAADGLTLLYGVDNSKIFEPYISGKLQNFTRVAETEFTALHSTPDAFFPEAGVPDAENMTQKTYWFFYENGEFKEYGSRDDLRYAELQAWPGGQEVLTFLYHNGMGEAMLERRVEAGATEEILELIAVEGGYLRDIHYRANGLVHLNYYGAENDNYYVTFLLLDGDLTVIEEGPGYYLTALLSAIAVIPETKGTEPGDGLTSAEAAASPFAAYLELPEEPAVDVFAEESETTSSEPEESSSESEESSSESEESSSESEESSSESEESSSESEESSSEAEESSSESEESSSEAEESSAESEESSSAEA